MEATRTNTALKAAALVVGAYVATLVAAAVVSGAIMIFLSPHGCGALSRALLVLWGALAALFLVSLAIVGFVAGRLRLGPLARVVWTVGYGLALLASYVAIAFGLMVAFNC